MSDADAFAGMREWIDGSSSRQAEDDRIAAAQRAELAARGETLADAERRWEAERAAFAERAHVRAVAVVTVREAKRRAGRRRRAEDAPEEQSGLVFSNAPDRVPGDTRARRA